MLTPALQLRRPDEALSRARQAVQVSHDVGVVWSPSIIHTTG
jgi:hypothetical protein